jgi:hypothetical protein
MSFAFRLGESGLDMAEWCKHIKLALDELRMMVLGVQALISLQFELAFQNGFATSSELVRQLIIVVLLLLLATFSVLIWGPSYHRVAVGGNCTEESHRFMSLTSCAALVPLGTALGLDAFIAFHRVGMRTVAIAAGVVVALLCFFLWYVLSAVRRAPDPDEVPKMSDHDPSSKPKKNPELHERVGLALTEARVVLPGAQAMLGFQFVTMFERAFEELPQSSKLVHLACLSLVALTVILLITPAAIHRIAEHGMDSERLVKLTGRFVMAATIPLAAAMAGEVYVVLLKVIESFPLALTAAIVTFIVMMAMWFGYTLLKRNRAGEHSKQTPSAAALAH